MAKGKLLEKALACGISSFLLFSSMLPFKADAKTIIDRDYNVDFPVAGVSYPKSQKPKTKVNVKVDLDEAGEKEYNLGISFYTKGWNERKKDVSDYVLVFGPGSRICIAYPKNINIDSPEEIIYGVDRKSPKNDKLDCFLEQIYPDCG